MGEEDVRRQKIKRVRMELLGAKVESVAAGSGTLKDAVNEALRYWVSHVHDTLHYGICSRTASIPANCS